MTLIIKKKRLCFFNEFLSGWSFVGPENMLHAVDMYFLESIQLKRKMFINLQMWNYLLKCSRVKIKFWTHYKTAKTVDWLFSHIIQRLLVTIYKIHHWKLSWLLFPVAYLPSFFKGSMNKNMITKHGRIFVPLLLCLSFSFNVCINNFQTWRTVAISKCRR